MATADAAFAPTLRPSVEVVAAKVSGLCCDVGVHRGLRQPAPVTDLHIVVPCPGPHPLGQTGVPRSRRAVVPLGCPFHRWPRLGPSPSRLRHSSRDRRRLRRRRFRALTGHCQLHPVHGSDNGQHVSQRIRRIERHLHSGFPSHTRGGGQARHLDYPVCQTPRTIQSPRCFGGRPACKPPTSCCTDRPPDRGTSADPAGPSGRPVRHCCSEPAGNGHQAVVGRTGYCGPRRSPRGRGGRGLSEFGDVRRSHRGRGSHGDRASAGVGYRPAGRVPDDG